MTFGPFFAFFRRNNDVNFKPEKVDLDKSGRQDRSSCINMTVTSPYQSTG